jgi:hypothetical protein
MYKVQIAKRLIDEEVRNNPEYAVPDWSKFEDDVVKTFGENSIQHLITVLYRYNAVRNDYVGQRIKMKKYTQGDEDGFYIQKLSQE